MNKLMQALETFEAVEANLAKVERLWDELRALFPSGLDMTNDYPQYDERKRQFAIVLASLPKIDGWLPQVSPPDPIGAGWTRFDYRELGDPVEELQWESGLWEPGAEIREYRFRFSQKRRALIREAMIKIIDQVDADLRLIRQEVGEVETRGKLTSSLWEKLQSHADQIEVLLGSERKPIRWSDFRRHLSYGHGGDLVDIEHYDWPSIKDDLRKNLYGANEPIPVAVRDLTDLVSTNPTGPVTTALRWRNLDADGFERLIFALISYEPGYENPEWLMQTSAPDRGRDLSVTRVSVDGLSGTNRYRIIIQCKHWLNKSIAMSDALFAKEQTKLWPNPRVDVLIIATSGRFTADAVQWIDAHNAAGNLPKIEMWAESALERLLAARPPLIAEFHLR